MNSILREFLLPSGVTLQLVRGDLTEETVDAIVNAANSHLQHGAGVAGAISRRGGALIQEESNAWLKEHGPVTHAKPAYTHGGKLPSRYVIHAVGPVWGEGDEDNKLEAAILGSLEVADQLHLTSIAFPAISTGIFGFPKARAAWVILSAILKYFKDNPSPYLHQVRLTLFDPPTLEAFLTTWQNEIEPDQ